MPPQANLRRHRHLHYMKGVVLVGQRESSTVVRVRLDLAYDGAPFSGWARQPSLPSVQAALEDSLELVLREPVRTVVAGRTDAGVHARAQTAHVDISTRAWHELAGGVATDPSPILVRRLNGALRRILGKDRLDRGLESANGAVVVTDAQQAPTGFDARFSALSRAYSYRIADAVSGHDPLLRHQVWRVERSLDVARMDRAVQELVGLHDFLSYCKPREGATTVRELQAASVTRDEQGLIVIRLQADAFCHHMVRSIAGTAVRVGQGSFDDRWMGDRLQSRLRDAHILMAPAQGLVLEAVNYPPDEALGQRADITRAKRESS